MVKIGVVGFGTIGERLADGIVKQEDKELVGVADVAPGLPVRVLVESGRGYPIYCSIPVFQRSCHLLQDGYSRRSCGC